MNGKRVLAGLLTLTVLTAGAVKFPEKAFRLTVERPVSITTNENSCVLVDFGRDSYGWLEFVSPVAGRYNLAIGEIVRDCSVWAPPLQSNIRYHRLKGKTNPGVFRVPIPIDLRNTSVEAGALPAPPHVGTIMPFRAVELAYGPFDAITWDNIRRVTVRYGYDLSESSFRCSDPRLERVWDFLKHTVAASTAFGLFVDGDRERIPYEGDSLATQLASYAVLLDAEIARATFERLMDHPTWPTEGKFCMVMMVWHDWQRTGKTDFAAKWYDRLVAEKLNAEKCRADGLLVTDVKRDCHALKLMSELASALGKASDAEAFAAKEAKMRETFNAVFSDPSTGLYLDGEGSRHSSLHANALPLAFGLVPEVRRDLVADFVASRSRQCSPYFMLYVLEGLCRSGREKDVFDALLAKGDRSWLGMHRLRCDHGHGGLEPEGQAEPGCQPFVGRHPAALHRPLDPGGQPDRPGMDGRHRYAASRSACVGRRRRADARWHYPRSRGTSVRRHKATGLSPRAYRKRLQTERNASGGKS